MEVGNNKFPKNFNLMNLKTKNTKLYKIKFLLKLTK